eukprot:6177608-Pleurochrysis_carterae.AAC.1
MAKRGSVDRLPPRALDGPVISPGAATKPTPAATCASGSRCVLCTRPNGAFETCSAPPHFKDVDKIQRNAILLYDVELTDANRLTKVYKQSIRTALSEQTSEDGKLASSMLPKN